MKLERITETIKKKSTTNITTDYENQMSDTQDLNISLSISITERHKLRSKKGSVIDVGHIREVYLVEQCTLRRYFILS